jgi:CHAT domain-containing protein
MLALASVSPRAWSASTFEACAREVAARSTVYESYRCYYEVANGNGEWAAAEKHLAALAAAHPGIDWIVFAQGLVAWPLDKDKAERLFLEAARRFGATSNVRGEVLARANLQTLFYKSGRLASAAREVERVTALAERTQDPEIRIRARVVEAQFFIHTGTNLGRAYGALKQAEADLDAMPTYWLRHHVLHGLGNVLLSMGQYDNAVTYFRRLQAEASDQQDLSTVAQARIDAANSLLEKRREEPSAVDSDQLSADAEAAWAAAKRAQEVDLQLTALRVLSETLMEERPALARGYVNTCVAQAKEHKQSQALSQCLWFQARLVADTEPLAAQRAIADAIELLHHEEGTEDHMLAFAWRHAMRVAWQIQPRDAAIATGKQALTAIERVRDLQPGLQSRAAAFSTWTQDYYWLSGQILHSPQSTALLDEAFQIGERMRARSLLDRLRAPPPSPTDLDDAALQRRENLLKQIVDVNRQLLKAKASESTKWLRELETLERQEIDARELQNRARITMRPVTLVQVQQRLTENEALLAFQVGPREGWLFAVTREQVRVYPLPERYAMSQSLALYKGLMNQSPTHRERAGRALYDQLLRQALEKLPHRITRLIVVPDSPLETFPLSALASQYEIALIPSATIWYDWRSRAVTLSSRRALVLADPQLEFASVKPLSWRPMSRLPYARAEGSEIIERLRQRGVLWTGAAASEAAFKASDLRHYSVLHFATHAVIDSLNADRSAILLASGTRQQDGLLQSREIADLPLAGQVVVLSSCQSAMGTQIRGEGVLGLARSFFAAGARTVIGSLWPIRDDHARAFFEPFYAALAQGRTVGEAFHQAQRRLIDKGLPMEAWAGFVLMGDATLKPLS